MPLRELELLQPRRFLRNLAAQTGLKLPEHDSSRLNWGAMILCLAATVPNINAIAKQLSDIESRTAELRRYL